MVLNCLSINVHACILISSIYSLTILITVANKMWVCVREWMSVRKCVCSKGSMTKHKLRTHLNWIRSFCFCCCCCCSDTNGENKLFLNCLIVVNVISLGNILWCIYFIRSLPASFSLRVLRIWFFARLLKFHLKLPTPGNQIKYMNKWDTYNISRNVVYIQRNRYTC